VNQGEGAKKERDSIELILYKGSRQKVTNDMHIGHVRGRGVESVLVGLASAEKGILGAE